MTNEEFIESIRLEGEEWKPVKMNQSYMVSSLGRVCSLGRVSFKNPQGADRFLKPKLLKQHKNHDGYFMLDIQVNGKRKGVSAHRLVALAFIPNPHNYDQVDHIDRDKANNKAMNLRWVNQSTNMQNRELFKYARKFKKHITKVQCFKDDVLVKEYDYLFQVKEDGFNPKGVSACCNGNRNFYHGYSWKYVFPQQSLVNQ